MDSSSFDALVQTIKAKKPMWFAGEVDPPATEEEVIWAERNLALKLPSSYKTFLKSYGGGYFALTNIFSAHKGSEWNIVDRNAELTLRDRFIAITDDETGGYYGFLVSNGSCSDEVYYVYPDEGSEPELKYSSFLEYVASVGLRGGNGG